MKKQGNEWASERGVLGTLILYHFFEGFSPCCHGWLLVFSFLLLSTWTEMIESYWPVCAMGSWPISQHLQGMSEATPSAPCPLCTQEFHLLMPHFWSGQAASAAGHWITLPVQWESSDPFHTWTPADCPETRLAQTRTIQWFQFWFRNDKKEKTLRDLLINSCRTWQSHAAVVVLLCAWGLRPTLSSAMN